MLFMARLNVAPFPTFYAFRFSDAPAFPFPFLVLPNRFSQSIFTRC